MQTIQTALQQLQEYGPIVLAFALFFAGLGVPVPASILILAAGAWARQGRFSLAFAFGCALFGAMCGSGGSYLMGRYGLKAVIRRLKQGRSWRRAEQKFQERAGTAIVLTRFLLTPLALPTNLIAGGERYPFGKFLLFCAAGEAVWVLLYGGLGYVFAASWRVVGSRVGQVGPWLLAGTAALFVFYELWSHARGQRPHTEAPAD